MEIATRFRAARAFALLVIVFAVVFSGTLLLLAFDQQQVTRAIGRLHEETLPETVRYQRLGRNLDQLRNEGERIFAAGDAATRQQSLFVITLIASHPSVLEHPQAAELARAVERMLNEAVRSSGNDLAAIKTRYPEWTLLAQRLSILVDDVLIEGTNLVTRDLTQVSLVMELARSKLGLAMALVGAFLVILLFLMRRHLISPLERIHASLTVLSVEAPAPEFKPSSMAEIDAVQRAILHLHALLVRNEVARHELESLANNDSLTGLANRRHFMALAETELARARRYQRPVTVGMIDLDEFKHVNDHYGHAAGDEVLRQFAAMLQDSMRLTDLACRYGGEEFAFLLPETALDEAWQLAERFRTRFAERDIVLPDGTVVRVTFSVGVADVGKAPIETALRHADDALYAAKRAGRNRVVAAERLPTADAENSAAPVNTLIH